MPEVAENSRRNRATSPIGFDARVSADGRSTLGPHATTLLADLDRHFTAWGREVDAIPMTYPPVLSVDDLMALDYFRNFPHLASVVTGLRAAALDHSRNTADRPTITGQTIGSFVTEAGQVLPSAACYGAYLDLAGRRLAGTTTLTTVATCFRREDSYRGLHRLFSFTMREIVCVGTREDVLSFLATVKDHLRAFTVDLGLEVDIAAAEDPFFDPDGARTLMQKLFPVKEEFRYRGDLAIASVNFHRNFFGERCDIRLPDGDPAFTGCVAFGLERWLAALGEHAGQDVRRLRQLLDGCALWRG